MSSVYHLVRTRFVYVSRRYTKIAFVRYTSYELLFDGRSYFEANEAFVSTAAAILKLMNFLID